ncbi:MAG: helix-turn-helix domain-containing protein [Altererythrobacter sp.]|nr:helix-turn-helix domain-containing protein [Altererythrobacter sp.]NNK46583.1 helix-turn-helix domain-containing protein [Altererythrobacter sp.]
MPHHQTAPVHQAGSYRAWDISGPDQIADLAWYCRVEHGQPEEHRLLPFCEPSLVIRRRFDRKGRTQDCRLLVSPAMPDGGQYAPEPGEEQIAVRLAPELMEATLGLRAAEYSDADRDLPRRLQLAFDRAISAAAMGVASNAMRELLRGLESANAAPDADRVTHAARMMRQSSGRISARNLAKASGVSSRHLRREFAERFGLSPRAMTRRLRLASAILEAEQHDRPEWAGIAAGHGFSDQAHMIRECRAIMGESPVELFRLRRPLAVSFNT